MTVVLALVTDAYGGTGGIAQAARDVISALAAQESIIGIEVVPRHTPRPVEGVPAKVRQAKPSPGRLAYTVRALAAALRTRPDLVFCNHLYMGPLAAMVAWLTGSKLIVQLHGIEVWPEPSSAQRRALEAAARLLCVSRDTRARALCHCDLPPERAVVLNNTVDPRFTPGDTTAARAKFGLSDEYVLLIVGRLDQRERYKGHDRLIAALPGLTHPDGRSIVLLIAGDGDDRARLEDEAVRAGVGSQVRFLGRVRDDDLPDLYRAADLFAMPSTGEGFGIAFLEAMACGTPALGLSVAGATDALGDGELGLIVRLEDDFAEALQGVIKPLTPPDGRVVAAVRDRFGNANFEKRLAALLDQLR